MVLAPFTTTLEGPAVGCTEVAATVVGVDGFPVGGAGGAGGAWVSTGAVLIGKEVVCVDPTEFVTT